MFTGIIEELGTVVSRQGAKLRLGAHTVLGEVQLGASIAVNGCCLTVVAWGDDWWEADVSDESYSRTNLGDLCAGDQVNLERPVRLEDRLGGHLVQGHVDDVGTVEEVRRLDDALLVDVRLPAELEPLMVPHGSVTVDGVSLTVNALPAPGILQLSLIEFTWRHTTLSDLRAGDRVQLEADMVGKYIRQLAAPYAAAAR